jgi:hypothetical protein
MGCNELQKKDFYRGPTKPIINPFNNPTALPGASPAGPSLPSTFPKGGSTPPTPPTTPRGGENTSACIDHINNDNPEGT